jgi:hypothetical protein
MLETQNSTTQDVADNEPSEWLKANCSIYENEPPIDDDYFHHEPNYDDMPEMPDFHDGIDWKHALNTHIDEFNTKYAVVLLGSKTVVMKTNYDDDRNRKERVYLSTQSFNTLHSNKKIKFGEKIVKDVAVDIIKSKSAAWLDNPKRAEYIDGIIFKPSQYRSGVEIPAKIHGNKLNLWEGYSIEPKQGEWRLLDKHIKDVICNCDMECVEYLYNWIARCLQYPEKTGQVAVALKGEKGCGKGTLGNFIKSIFGQHGLQVTNPKHLTGNFNAHLADCCFLFADEVFFAGDKVVENIMKGLITEPTLMLESKGIDAIETPNRLKIFMASNNDWIAPATKDERRYFVLDVSSEKIGDTDYFNALHRDINNPAIQAAFLHEMLHRDISKFNVSKVPDTAALKEQRAQTLDTFGQYWLDVLQRGVIFESQHNNHELQNWINEPALDLVQAGYEQWRNKNKITQFGIIKRETIGRHLSNWYKKNRSNFQMPVGENSKGELLKSGSRPYTYVLGNQSDAIKAFCEFEKLDADKLLKFCQ